MSFWELNIAYRNGGPYGLLSTKFAPLAQTSCYATGDSDCWELIIAYRNGGQYGLLSTKFAPLAQTSCYATGDSDC